LQLCAVELLLYRSFAFSGHLFGVNPSVIWLAWLEELGVVLLLTHTSNRVCVLGLTLNLAGLQGRLL
jgi:hypothetical protein